MSAISCAASVSCHAFSAVSSLSHPQVYPARMPRVLLVPIKDVSKLGTDNHEAFDLLEDGAAPYTATPPLDAVQSKRDEKLDESGRALVRLAFSEWRAGRHGNFAAGEGAKAPRQVQTDEEKKVCCFSACLGLAALPLDAMCPPMCPLPLQARVS